MTSKFQSKEFSLASEIYRLDSQLSTLRMAGMGSSDAALHLVERIIHLWGQRTKNAIAWDKSQGRETNHFLKKMEMLPHLDQDGNWSYTRADLLMPLYSRVEND